MTWEKEKKNFVEFIFNQEVIGFFKEPLKLKSGRLSYWYVNWRNVAEDVYSMDKLTDFVFEFIEDLNLKPDCFYGVPEGATKLGVIAQYKWAKRNSAQKNEYVLSMGRARPKEHGDPKDKFFLGVPRGKVIVLEDVTTTGGSLIQTIHKLESINTNIIAAIGLTNRNELRDDGRSVKQAISDLGIKYYAMSDALELIPELYHKSLPGKEIKEHIEHYFQKYGIESIKL